MKRVPILYIVFAGIAWGTACIFINALTKFQLESSDIAAGRCLIGACCALLYTLIKNPKSLKLTLKQFIIVAVCGFAFFMMATFYYDAMKSTSVATASVLLNMAPIAVIGYSVVFLNEKLTKRKMIMVLCALLGCLLVTGGVGGFKFSTRGIFYGVLSGISYATYSICVKIATKNDIDSGAVTAYSFSFASIISILFVNYGILVEKVLQSPVRIGLLILGIGFVTGFFASFLYSKAMRYLSAGIVSALASIEPFTTVMLSIIFLNERLKLSAVIGMIMIFTSAVVLGKESLI